MKNSLVAVLCVAAILLAATDLWTRASTVHAQGGGRVYVDLVSLNGRSEYVRSGGSTIVGFSCVANSAGTICYVASQ